MNPRKNPSILCTTLLCTFRKTPLRANACLYSCVSTYSCVLTCSPRRRLSRLFLGQSPSRCILKKGPGTRVNTQAVQRELVLHRLPTAEQLGQSKRPVNLKHHQSSRDPLPNLAAQPGIRNPSLNYWIIAYNPVFPMLWLDCKLIRRYIGLVSCY